MIYQLTTFVWIPIIISWFFCICLFSSHVYRESTLWNNLYKMSFILQTSLYVNRLHTYCCVEVSKFSEPIFYFLRSTWISTCLSKVIPNWTVVPPIRFQKLYKIYIYDHMFHSRLYLDGWKKSFVLLWIIHPSILKLT
jgi:hypothetical protein